MGRGNARQVSGAALGSTVQQLLRVKPPLSPRPAGLPLGIDPGEATTQMSLTTLFVIAQC